MSVVLDGKLLASKIKEELIKEIEAFKKQHQQVPSIVSIVVGADPSSLSYIGSQKRTAESLGVHYELRELPLDISEEKLIAEIIQPLNVNMAVHGILLNKPMPGHINFDSAASSIVKNKNIEGHDAFHLGELLLGKMTYVPCTAAAALELLKSSGLVLSGKKAVVIGRSEIVGKPIALLLLKENMTVTICHSKTNLLKEEVQQADVIVAAIGQPLFVKADWIKLGAVVIDVGINQCEGKIVGDVDFEGCKSKASFITPVPGGVGPVTSMMLMKNTVEALKQSL